MAPSARMILSEKNLERIQPPASGQFMVRDADLNGFYLLVGVKRRTYMVQADLRQSGKRLATVKVKVGDAAAMTARDARGIAKSYLGEISQGRHPIQPEIIDNVIVENSAGTGVTLREAWSRYLESHMLRKERSENTINDYRDYVERVFTSWLDTPLKELADDPAKVAKRHDEITRNSGPYRANYAMRVFRAIYNHARKTNRSLPADNPVEAVDWNKEERRDSAMGAGDLPAWFDQLAKLDNPIRREFHLLVLLSGSRPTALKSVRLENLDKRKRVLHIPKPKGGAERAFDIPLSHQMIRSIIRVIRHGRDLFSSNDGWLFPADSASGHITVHKERRTDLSKYGNDLRQSYRTLAAIAGVSEVDAKLLMNHAIPGVNSGYITRHKLLEDHLRHQQQAISNVILERFVGSRKSAKNS
jgi:site-specific recombinase XerD